MASPQPTTPTAADINRFELDGYLVVKQAFARVDTVTTQQR
jgi:hypothetical protein